MMKIFPKKSPCGHGGVIFATPNVHRVFCLGNPGSFASTTAWGKCSLNN